ncbi:hypothetical protein LIER_24657 [Lithospermum erythrorhizon]|uniref:Uncharacterized protein n=1 Tax=Lithospermum erythrorhizon TaxID=34254 RepID=A0AAV3R217_LITER
MAAEAPSWADQCGAGGFGSIEGDDNAARDAGNEKKKKKSIGGKAKIVAGKVKKSMSSGVKWIKNKCQKKTSS